MKKTTKKKLRVVAKRIAKILIILLIIIIIYSAGHMRGLVDGVYVVQTRNNETVCDFLNLTRDTDGFCLLREEEHKYRHYLDCGWEKFKIRGERKPPFFYILGEDIQQIIFYPALGC